MIAAGRRTLARGMSRATDPNALSLPELFASLTRDGSLDRLLALARDEDMGGAGDVTSRSCIAPGTPGRAELMARGEGVVAGLAAVPSVLRAFGSGVSATMRATDGDGVAAGRVLCVLQGELAELLAVERTMLNLVGRLSGVATQTRRYVHAIGSGTRAKLYDTRKTTPGLRALEKYAVRCGGGHCHRVGLFDAVLIKDNHIAGVGPALLGAFLREASAKVRAAGVPLKFIEVEVDSLEQLDAVLALEPGVVDIVLLDNMSPSTMREACARRGERAPWLELEASGGVTLTTIRAVAETGVDRISVGALTHSAPQLDVALDVVSA